jgi:hypothetical protein
MGCDPDENRSISVSLFLSPLLISTPSGKFERNVFLVEPGKRQP